MASENNGSGFFFPSSNKQVWKQFFKEIEKIPEEFWSLARNNSRNISSYKLSFKDLSKERCLSIHSSVLEKNIPEFVTHYGNVYNKPKRWHIDNFPNRSQIIIPRASRKYHAIYLNPFWNECDVYFSSNFVCLWKCNIDIDGLTQQEILEFIAAYLNSSFGQIMFEKEAEDREGLRKIEVTPIKTKIFVPRINDIPLFLIKEIINEFNRLPFGITGMEGESNNPRYNLDVNIARLLFIKEPTLIELFSSAEELGRYSEKILKEIVRIRIEI